MVEVNMEIIVDLKNYKFLVSSITTFGELWK